MSSANVEEKLFQNRYKVDAGRPHIGIKNPEICANSCKTQHCTSAAPPAATRWRAMVGSC